MGHKMKAAVLLLRFQLHFGQEAAEPGQVQPQPRGERVPPAEDVDSGAGNGPAGRRHDALCGAGVA